MIKKWALAAYLVVSTSAGAVEIVPSNAEPVITIGPSHHTFLDLAPPIMPLVDPAALDNKPEDMIRHYMYHGDNVRFYLLVGMTDAEYDEIAGRLLRPNPASDVKRIPVRLPNNYVLFGKYKLVRNPNNGGHFFLWRSTVHNGAFGYTKRWRLQ